MNDADKECKRYTPVEWASIFVKSLNTEYSTTMVNTVFQTVGEAFQAAREKEALFSRDGAAKRKKEEVKRGEYFASGWWGDL